MKLRIKGVIEHAPKIKTLIIDIEEYPIEFKPGQFLLASAEVHGQPVSRAYSICNPTSVKDSVEILFKVYEDGQLTPTLNGLRTGDTLDIKAPFGQFLFDETDKKVCFVAGGTGIAPILCFIRTIAEKNLNIESHLFYGAQDPDELVFREELKRIGDTHPNVHLHFTVDKEDPVWEGRVGYPDIDWIKGKIEDLNGFVFYLCGPRAMVDKVQDGLEKRGVDNSRIRVDHW